MSDKYNAEWNMGQFKTESSNLCPAIPPGDFKTFSRMFFQQMKMEISFLPSENQNECRNY